MAGRFVSGGTIDSREDGASESVTAGNHGKDESKPAKSAEWELVEKELAAERQRREEQRRKAATGEEKSLYDILQDNKAAKQAAFEEQNKIKNQFRALDDDEVDFLDEVREKKRRAEEQVKRETAVGLEAFRQAQKGGASDVGTAVPEDQPEDIEENWGVGRKRRRVKEREVKGVRRKLSTNDEAKESNEAEKRDEKKTADEAGSAVQAHPVAKPQIEVQKKPPALGLGDYGSDSE